MWIGCEPRGTPRGSDTWNNRETHNKHTIVGAGRRP